MKFSQATLLAACVPAISARFVEPIETDNVIIAANDEKFLIELAPGETQWVTEEEKWELRRVCVPREIPSGFNMINVLTA